MLKILVSNDDGYDSPGLEVLVENLKEVAELCVVAPESRYTKSGCSLKIGKSDFIVIKYYLGID